MQRRRPDGRRRHSRAHDPAYAELHKRTHRTLETKGLSILGSVKRTHREASPSGVLSAARRTSNLGNRKNKPTASIASRGPEARPRTSNGTIREAENAKTNPFHEGSNCKNKPTWMIARTSVFLPNEAKSSSKINHLVWNASRFEGSSHAIDIASATWSYTHQADYAMRPIWTPSHTSHA